MEILLFKIPGTRLDEERALALVLMLTEGAAAASVDVHAGTANEETYAYYRPSGPIDEAMRDTLRARVQAVYPAAHATLLRNVQDIPGSSHGKAAAWHYIVETDVLPEAEADLNAWYDNEHLPGLAAVPGTVRAQRFVNDAGSPSYHACYDLQTIETFESPPWMAVRATDWSSRVRPHFRNTRRAMFRKVA